jgi:outer membrane protein OmpA-like peptidoglycan-associated protein
MRLIRMRQRLVLGAILVAGAVWAPAALADEHIRGVITNRFDNGTVTIDTDDASTLTVVVNDSTKVRREVGMRQVKASSASLVPGLRIRLAGEYDGPTRFVAERITFSRSDLKIARAIRGGIEPTDARSVENQRRIAEHERLLAQQQQTIAQQEQKIASNREQIKANEERLVATTGTVERRIGNLDDYRVISTVTVYFKNGATKVGSAYKKQLRQLAEQAQNVPGYKIQVQGHASAVGPNALNDYLSMHRADAVAAVLTQSGISPTNMAVPATMGTSQQVESNANAKGQAANRRTVVTLLQNKGIGEK